MPRAAIAKRRAAAPSPRPAHKHESLLVELRTEELPPKSLKRLSEAFAENLAQRLREAGLIGDDAKISTFATPRRLALHCTRVQARQTDRESTRLGPKTDAPAQAIEGFAKSLGVARAKLETKDGRYAYTLKIAGQPLAKLIGGLIEQALAALPIPKLMRWGGGDAEFVRPVHGLLLLHGAKLIAATVLEAKSGRTTLGHRFLSQGPLSIAHADRYASILKTKGKVIADFAARRGEIVKQLRRAAAKHKALVSLPERSPLAARGGAEGDRRRTLARTILGANDALLDEVTALVEWPKVYVGTFEREFLSVPAQCISLTMQKNQRYFALLSERAELLPVYLIVSNMEVPAPKVVIEGNARVLRARLADAKFFYDQDRKTRLETRVSKLAQIVYQSKLGSQFERVKRLQALSAEIAKRLRLSSSQISETERAAQLAKADLPTEMVGEFPELQGVIGASYARHDGEPEAVAEAIDAHYRPRQAGDDLPSHPVSIALALADKLEALIGLFGVGLAPTGDKDPYALRRHALGALRILVEKSLALDALELVHAARAQFDPKLIAERSVHDVYAFMLERLRTYLRERQFAADEIDAVLSLNPTRLDLVLPRIDALREFRRLPEAEALAAANKRIHNILKQAGDGEAGATVDGGLLKEEAETRLSARVSEISKAVSPLFAANDYVPALKQLAGLRESVDRFFDEVMVMVEDEDLRQARLSLLARVRNLFLHVADISRLQS